MSEKRSARIINKNTIVSGRIPTGTTSNEDTFIHAGELASNLADQAIFGYDGTKVFEYGSKSFLKLSGGTLSGSLSANKFLSGSTNIENIFSTKGELGLKANLSGSTFSGPIYSPIVNSGIVSATTYSGIEGSFGITIDGHGSEITSGIKGYLTIPYNAKILGWNIVSSLSGSCYVDILKSSTFPTISDVISGTEGPSLIEQQKNSKNNLVDWDIDVYIGDIISFNVLNTSNIKWVNLIIKVKKI